MIRDLMVPMTATAGDQAALDASIALAQSLDAHLSVIESVGVPMPLANTWGLQPEMAMASVYDQVRELGESNAARLRGRLQRESVSWEVRVVESFFVEPPRTVAVHARYADISVLPAARQDSPGDAAIIAAYFNALLFESGRPVLVVPPRQPMVFPVAHAVVAWQPSREASRALHDALPLLRASGTVDVVVVDPVVGEYAHGPQPGADIAVHLSRHGIQANVVVHARRQHESVAAALFRCAADSGAQLLVAGGYGHSRLREWAVGGTTRELLETASTPVLFSH